MSEIGVRYYKAESSNDDHIYVIETPDARRRLIGAREGSLLLPTVDFKTSKRNTTLTGREKRVVKWDGETTYHNTLSEQFTLLIEPQDMEKIILFSAEKLNEIIDELIQKESRITRKIHISFMVDFIRVDATYAPISDTGVFQMPWYEFKYNQLVKKIQNLFRSQNKV
jgi:hypothetical protein